MQFDIKILFQTFPHSWFTNRFLIRVTRCVPLDELDLPTLPEHLSSSPFFCRVHVAQSLVYCVVFYRSMVVFHPFSFLPMYCLFFFILQLLITLLVSSNIPFSTLTTIRDLLKLMPIEHVVKLF